MFSCLAWHEPYAEIAGLGNINACQAVPRLETDSAQAQLRKSVGYSEPLHVLGARQHRATTSAVYQRTNHSDVVCGSPGNFSRRAQQSQPNSPKPQMKVVHV